MKIDDYRPRLIDKKLDFYLSTFGAVCVEGPKWCGKTWTSTVHAKSAFFVGDPAADLVRIAAKFVRNPPRSLAVVVGKQGIAHRRKDGVYVLPITALKP